MKNNLLFLFLIFCFLGFSQEKKNESNLKSSEEIRILIGPEKITEVIGLSISKLNNNILNIIIVDKNDKEVFKMLTPEFSSQTFKINVDNLPKGEYNLKILEHDKLIFQKKIKKIK